jgi:hypothetical protein
LGLFFKTESEITPEALDVAVRTALARPASTNADDEAEIVEGVEREDKVAPRWVAIAVAAAILLVGASLTTWVVVSGVLEPDGLRGGQLAARHQNQAAQGRSAQALSATTSLPCLPCAPGRSAPHQCQRGASTTRGNRT